MVGSVSAISCVHIQNRQVDADVGFIYFTIRPIIGIWAILENNGVSILTTAVNYKLGLNDP